MLSPSPIECVVNISEGNDSAVLEALVVASGASFLDVHSDKHHNRSVFTLAGENVEADVRTLAVAAAGLIDLRDHVGVHPRIGVIDVVPFVPLWNATWKHALAARNAFAQWMNDELDVPCFLYGPERSLPDIRRQAFKDLQPDIGAPVANARSGACAVGARNLLIAYNLWLKNPDLSAARHLVKELRRPAVRVLALPVGEEVQISCNLIDPLGHNGVGPAQIYDEVNAKTPVNRAELVGLIPEAMLTQVPESRWGSLDLAPSKTIESCLATQRR